MHALRRHVEMNVVVLLQPTDNGVPMVCKSVVVMLSKHDLKTRKKRFLEQNAHPIVN